MEIRRLTQDDVDLLLSARELFDEEPDPALSREFLGSDGHHCLLAMVEGRPVGFVTGVEIRHPDKATEMLLYELGVAEAWRRRGIGRALTEALGAIASTGGMRGMWVLTERANASGLATYRSAGADEENDAVLLEWRLGEA